MVIFTKFHEDGTKNVNFLLLAIFWACLVFYSPDFNVIWRCSWTLFALKCVEEHCSYECFLLLEPFLNNKWWFPNILTCFELKSTIFCMIKLFWLETELKWPFLTETLMKEFFQKCRQAEGPKKRKVWFVHSLIQILAENTTKPFAFAEGQTSRRDKNEEEIMSTPSNADFCRKHN